MERCIPSDYQNQQMKLIQRVLNSGNEITFFEFYQIEKSLHSNQVRKWTFDNSNRTSNVFPKSYTNSFDLIHEITLMLMEDVGEFLGMGGMGNSQASRWSSKSMCSN